MPTLRQLRYFVAIAEELSFVRAAARLHVSQPPLSSQLKSLEDELGIVLLRRDTRTVQLTEAGKVFLDGTQRVLADLQQASRQAVRTATGEIGVLRIGFVSRSMISVLPRVLSRLRAQLPDVEFALLQQSSRGMVQCLQRSDIDMALFNAPSDLADIEVHTIFREPLCAILPPKHPLGRVEPFDLRLLAHEPFVNFERASAPVMFDTIVGACMQAGFSPRIRHTGDFFAMVQMVALGLGVALVPATFAEQSADRVAVRRIERDSLGVSVEVAWLRDTNVALVRRAASALLTNPLPTHPPGG